MPQLSLGETAPDFSLPGTAGDDIREYRLSDHLEDGPVVLTFYPFDFPLLSDRMGEVAERFDVLHEEWEGHPRVSQRAVVAIDRDQTIRYRWSTEESLEQPTLDEMGDAVEWWRAEESS